MKVKKTDPIVGVLILASSFLLLVYFFETKPADDSLNEKDLLQDTQQWQL